MDSLPPTYRSEAFAEDVAELAPAPQPWPPTQRSAMTLWINLLPVAVALVGLAFAVLPPAV